MEGSLQAALCMIIDLL